MIRIAPVDTKAAKYAVENWHYSGRLPAPKSVFLGVWENGVYIGVVIFGRGASSHLGEPYGLSMMEVCELTRVALREHVAPVSQIVTAAVEHLRKTSPGLRLIVSFADPYHGHKGGIYQAMNWLYLGVSAATPMYRRKSDGVLLHNRVVSADGYRIQFGVRKPCVKHSDCTLVKVPGKHRYVLPLDRAMRRQLMKRVLPYPQSADEISTGDTTPTGEEGWVRSPESAPTTENTIGGSTALTSTDSTQPLDNT